MILRVIWLREAGMTGKMGSGKGRPGGRKEQLLRDGEIHKQYTIGSARGQQASRLHAIEVSYAALKVRDR